MHSHFKPSETLSLQGNVAENWKCWKQKFDIFLTAKEATEKADSIKIAMLPNTIGEEALDRYNQFTYKQGEDERK